MRIQTTSWHYRMLKWTYGPGFFWSCGHDHDKDSRAEDYKSLRKQVNLCPYVDWLVFAIASSPFVATGRVLAAGYRTLSANLKTVAILTALSLLLSIAWSITVGPYGIPIAFGLVWGVFGFIYLLHAGWKHLSDRLQIIVVITVFGAIAGLIPSVLIGPLGILVGIGVSWAGAGASWAYDKYKAGHVSTPKPPKPPKVRKEKPAKVKKPRQPSILMEWLRAKHRKICPFIEFD